MTVDRCPVRNQGRKLQILQVLEGEELQFHRKFVDLAPGLAIDAIFAENDRKDQLVVRRNLKLWGIPFLQSLSCE